MTLGPTPILTLTLPLSTGVVEAIPKTLPLPLTPDSDLLTRQVSPDVEVTEADEAYVLEMVDRCADTHLPVRATHACLLRAVRSEGLGQLAPGALRTTSIRASYAYQPPACRT